MKLLRLHADDAEVRELLAQSDEYMASLYPPESNHMAGPEELLQANVHFIGVSVDGALAGCGAARVLAEDVRYAEIKRLFVPARYRGRGIATRIMNELESWLDEQRVDVVRLETGIHQPEAIRLYEKLGYRYRAPFGSYRADPYSLFMEKNLRKQCLEHRRSQSCLPDT